MTTNTPRYLNMTADELIALVQQGEGDSIGLPAVPLDKLEDTVDMCQTYIASKVWEIDPFVSDLIDAHTLCSECDTHPDSLTPQDRAIHIMAGAYVLVGCEGFHTAMLRVIFHANND